MVEEFLKATEQISLLETALFCLDKNKIYLGKKPKTSLELVGLLSKYFKKKKMSRGNKLTCFTCERINFVFCNFNIVSR